MRRSFENSVQMDVKVLNRNSPDIFFLAQVFKPHMNGSKEILHETHPETKTFGTQMIYFLGSGEKPYNTESKANYLNLLLCLTSVSTRDIDETNYFFEICPTLLNKPKNLFSSSAVANNK